MAEIETLNQSAADTIAPPATRPHGQRKHDRGRIQRDGAAAPVMRAPDAAAASGLEGMGLWDQMAALSESDWGFHACYVYRIEPPIRNDDKAFIEKRTQAFDENDILATHGSGRYLLILNNIRQRKAIGKLTFTCHRDDMPPKVKLSQLAAHAEESWRVWLNEVEERKAQATRPGTVPTDTTRGESDVATGEAVRQLAEITKRVLDQQARTGTHDGKEAGPVIDPVLADLLGKMASGRDELAARLSDRSNGPAPADPITLLEKAANVLAKLQPQREAAPPPPPPPDPLAQIQRTIEVVALLRESFGGSGDGPASPSTLQTIITSLPGILQQSGTLIGTVMQGIAMARAVGTAPGSPKPPASGVASTSTAHPMPQAPPQLNAPTPVPAQPIPEQPTQVSPEQSQQDIAVDQLRAELFGILAKHGPTMLNWIDQGRPGDEFADWLLDGDARSFHILASLALGPDGTRTPETGVANLLTIMKSDPAGAALVAPIETAVVKFAVEFYGFDPDAPDGEDSDPEDDGDFPSGMRAHTRSRAGQAA